MRTGQAGEAAVRAVYDIGDKIPIQVAGRIRIPDGLTSTVLSEVKNVHSLSYTQQLRDYAAYARLHGLRFDLYVRSYNYLISNARARGRERGNQTGAYSMRREKVTAAELMAKLNADPKYVAARQREEQERQQRAQEWRHAEAPLVEELRAAGFTVESAWDLVNTPGSYPAAVPILLEHLPRQYPAAVRECIARALAVPEAKIGWDLLIRLYRDEREARAKDGLAVAIAAAADDALIDDVIALARNVEHGPSRLLLLSALERSASARARAALMELGTDAELKKEIQVILRRLKGTRR